MKHAFRNKSFDIGTTKNEWLSCARGAASCAHMLYGATRVFPQSTLSDLWTDRHTVVGGIEKGVGKEIAKWKHVVSVSWAPPLRPLSFAFPLGVSVLVKCFLMCSGDSANAVPPTKKSRTRVTNMCGDRRCQPNRSAMERPHSGPTALVIAVQPVPGKYDCGWQNGNNIEAPAELRCLTPISITLHLWITSKKRRRRITCIGWARQSHRMKHCLYLLLHPILI